MTGGKNSTFMYLFPPPLYYTVYRCSYLLLLTRTSTSPNITEGLSLCRAGRWGSRGESGAQKPVHCWVYRPANVAEQQPEKQLPSGGNSATRRHAAGQRGAACLCHPQQAGCCHRLTAEDTEAGRPVSTAVGIRQRLASDPDRVPGHVLGNLLFAVTSRPPPAKHGGRNRCLPCRELPGPTGTRFGRRMKTRLRDPDL